MQIKELIIYGYGKFEQVHIKLLPFHFIYGKNEAGKSTIISFIHSILFGFPLKHQTEPRYEPKTSSKYGGQVVLADEKWGNVRVERVKGKAAGDVTVTLEDGTRGGEELLRKILQEMDKQTFRSVYSFDIHGLQNVHKVKREDLTKFLFSTGAVGNDKIMEAEQVLQKELDQLYKPYGSKPPVNEKLAQLKEIDQQLKEAKGKIAAYEDLLKSRSKIAEQIADLRKKREEIMNEMIYRKEWNRIYPLLKEKRKIEKQLKNTGEIRFPENGKIKYEQAIAEKKRLEKSVETLTGRLEKIDRELQNLKISEEILHNKAEIQCIIEDLPGYREDRRKLDGLQLKLKELDAKIREMRTKLNFQEDDDCYVFHFDLSFAQKDRIKKLTNKKHHLEEQKKELEKKESKLQRQLKEKENFVRQLKGELLNPVEREKYERILAEHEKKMEIEYLTRQIQSAENGRRNKKQNEQRTKKMIYSFSVMLAISVILVFAGFVQIAIGLLTATAILYIFFIMNEKQQPENNGQSTPEVMKRDALEEMINGISPEKINLIKEKLENDRHVEKQLSVELLRLEQLEQQFNEVVTDFEKWESQWKQIEKEIADTGMQYRLPAYIAREHLMESFELLETLRTSLTEKKQIEEEIAVIQEKMNKRNERLSSFYERAFSLPGNEYEYDDKVLKLKTILEKQIETEMIRKEKLNKRKELEDEIEAAENEIKFFEEQIRTLFREADADSESSFYGRYTQLEKMKQLKSKLAYIDRQLIHTTIKIPGPEEELLQGTGETEFRELEREKEILTKRIEQLEKEEAAVKHQIELIEEGGTYTELLHRYHQEKYELRTMAKKWAVYKTALYTLQQAMDKYKRERLPKVLRQARLYFSSITNGEYVNIYLDEKQDRLIVERKDGIIFTPDELSQATGEQLYLSLRLALAVTGDRERTYPIIIDDGFVHFDDERRKQVMKLLREISLRTQILFFSCHATNRPYFNEEETYVLQ